MPEAAPTATPPFTPRARLFTEHVQVDMGSYYAPDFQEVEAPAIQLTFDYGSAGASSPPDADAEGQARFLLESLGALELSCAEHVEAPPGSAADYLVRLDGDVHARCAFAAYAVPQLRDLGWQVEVDPGYRWKVLDDGACPWYASLEAEEDADWFSLELGVEHEGRRVNLLPTLLDLLQSGPRSLAGLLRRRRCVAIPVGERGFLALPPERLRLLAEVLMELYGERTPCSQGGVLFGGEAQLCEDRLRVPAACADALARLERALEEPGRRGRGRRRLRWRGATDALARARAAAATPAPVRSPEGLRAELRPYQREGVAWLQHLTQNDVGGILADDMGLGKTLQTIAHLLLQHNSGGVRDPSLVVVPTSLVGNWRRELRRFAPGLWVTVYHGARRRRSLRLLPSSDVVITTYPVLTRDRELLGAQPFHLVILDEAQAIKNNRSQTHRAVCALEARHRLCLTGTPLENNLGEIWSLFDFLMPGFLGDRQQFGERFAQPIESGGDERSLHALRRRVAPFILRREKEGVARELPEKTEIVRPVEIAGAQRELYESIRIAAHAQVRHAIAERGMARSTVAILDALMKLRQVCCDPRLVRMNAARAVTGSAKLELLLDLLPRQLAQGRRVLLFSQFTSMLALIGQELRQRGLRHVTLTGQTRDRQARLDEFQHGFADLFLISLKAGGTGLNLTRADTVIHYDPWWNPAAQAQATDRAHRIGQTRPVFVYNLIVAGSVEERMLQLQRRKRTLARSLLGGGGSFRDLTQTEVDSLFSPLGDRVK